MAYQKIELSAADDGQGDDARTGGGKINSNFEELYSRNFKIGSALVSRFEYDPYALSFAAYKVDDRTWGFVDAAKTRFVDGFVLAVPFIFPDNVDDVTKFFKITDEININ